MFGGVRFRGEEIVWLVSDGWLNGQGNVMVDWVSYWSKRKEEFVGYQASLGRLVSVDVALERALNSQAHVLCLHGRQLAQFRINVIQM